ncbi:MAG: hypothetical protein ABIH20_01120 [Candidatus Diapherotrites archaeon]
MPRKRAPLRVRRTVLVAGERKSVLVERSRTHIAEVRVNFSSHEKSDKSQFHPSVIAPKGGVNRMFTSQRKSDWDRLKRLLKKHRVTPDGYHYKKPSEKKRRKLTRGEINELSSKKLRKEN